MAEEAGTREEATWGAAAMVQAQIRSLTVAGGTQVSTAISSRSNHQSQVGRIHFREEVVVIPMDRKVKALSSEISLIDLHQEGEDTRRWLLGQRKVPRPRGHLGNEFL